MASKRLPKIEAYSPDQARDRGRFASGKGTSTKATKEKKSRVNRKTSFGKKVRQNIRHAAELGVIGVGLGAATVATSIGGPVLIAKGISILGKGISAARRAWAIRKAMKFRAAKDAAAGIINGTFKRVAPPAGLLASADDANEIHAYSPDQARDRGRFATGKGGSANGAAKSKGKKEVARTPRKKTISQKIGSVAKSAAGHAVGAALHVASDPRAAIAGIVLTTVAAMKIRDMVKGKSASRSPVHAADGALIFGEAVDAEIIEAAANPEGRSLPSFSVPAYTGGKLKVKKYDYPVVVDVDGLEFSPEIHANLFHDRTQIVGHATEATKTDGNRGVFMRGLISGTGPAAQEVIGNHLNGFKWKASIEAQPLERPELIVAGDRKFVNGQWQQGPFLYVPRSRLVGVAFLPVGADHDARIQIAAEAALS